MALQSGAGVKLAIGTTAAATNQTQYEADTYTNISKVENIGEIGDAFNLITFISLEDARVNKLKGSADAGDVNPNFAFDTEDAGQAALITAGENTTSTPYNLRLQYNDGTTTPTTRYCKVLVGGTREVIGGADDVLMLTAPLYITSAILKVAAT